MRRQFADDNPGAECSIAGTLSWTGLDENPNDLSNPDFGGPILLDVDGNLYVDVVLHNQRPATDDPIGDPLPDLEKSSAHFM